MSDACKQEDLTDTANRSQNHAQCLSDAQNVKVYRNGCEGCVHANQGVCCGGVR